MKSATLLVLGFGARVRAAYVCRPLAAGQRESTDFGDAAGFAGPAQSIAATSGR